MTVEEFDGHRLPRSIQEKLDPARTALVVVDVQNDFIHDDGYFGGSAALQGIVEPIRLLADAARTVGVPVHFGQIVQEPDGSASSAVWITEALRRGYEPRQCMSGTWGAANVDELAPQAGDRVHLKRRRSVFRGTDLEAELRAAGVTTVVLVGLAASGCVGYTTRDCLELDFHPVVAVDGVADAGDPVTDGVGRDWRPHYEGLLPAENVLDVAGIRTIWGL